jgi:hypothetical protein
VLGKLWGRYAHFLASMLQFEPIEFHVVLVQNWPHMLPENWPHILHDLTNKHDHNPIYIFSVYLGNIGPIYYLKIVPMYCSAFLQ